MYEAMRSFERCRKVPSFFEDFYREFFALHPEVRGRFPIHLEDQFYLLREALDLILQFPSESAMEPTILSKVAESHGARGIDALLYDTFTQTLLSTVKKHDPRCKGETVAQEILEAWKLTIAPALEYLKGRIQGASLGTP